MCTCLASRHKRLGVALRAVLQGPKPGRQDVDWPESPQAGHNLVKQMG